MSVPTTSWDETSPAGSQAMSLGDDRIRELKTQLREVIGVDHKMASSGNHADNGCHNKVSLLEQADIGTGAVGKTILGSQTVAGKGELCYVDEDDNTIQLTDAGGINAVRLTSDQTVAGIKTFSSIPLLPASDPTTANQAARKAYVDAAALAVYPDGYVDGGVLSNAAGDVTNDLTMTALNCKDATFTYALSVAAMTKRVDATWTAGDGGGGLDTGTIGASAVMVYIWAIGKVADAAAGDVLFSKSGTAPTMPATWDVKRLIGGRRWSGSAWELFTTYGNGVTKKVYFSTWLTLTTDSVSLASFTSLDIANFVPGVISKICFGTLSKVSNNFIAISNKSTGNPDDGASTGNRIKMRETFSGGEIVQTTMLWHLNVLTTDTLWFSSDSTSNEIFLMGYEENL